ncbi:ABC transporter permease [bacterium]|nr:ABC transporter permease [bacterium]
MLQPLRSLLRRLGQTPGFTLIAVLTLAIGIGANSAIFSVVEGVLLRPLPFAEPDRLVALRHAGPGIGIPDFEQSTTTYTVYRDEADSLSSAALYTDFTMNLTGVGEPTHVEVVSTTASLFEVLQRGPALGRPLIGDDEQGEGARVVVLSDALWRSRFGAAPDIVGRTMQLSGNVWEVVGVMPPRFEFPRAGIDLWVPFVIDPESLGRINFSYEAVARLAPGATVASAELELNRLLAEIPDRYPGEFTHRLLEDVRMSAVVWPLREYRVGEIGNILWLLLGTVGFILLIACANVANLFLVRAEGRQREVALRTALGAGFGDTVRYFLAESLVLSLTGGALGLGLAWVGVRTLIGLSPMDIPRAAEVGLNPTVLAFTAAISLLAGVAFGLFPIVRYGRDNLALALKSGGRGGSADRGTHRVRKLLAASQVALALVLLVGAGLMARSFIALKQVEPGFDPDGLLVFRVSLPGESYPGAHDTANFIQRLLEELEGLPGVTSVGAISNLPMTDGQSNNGAIPEGMPIAADELPPIARTNYAAPGYFKTVGIPLLEGRPFDRRDHENETAVMLISAELAQRFWPGESAIGKRLAPGLPDDDEPEWFTVVGVVGDVRDDGPTQPVAPMVYYPLVGRPDGNADWTVRTVTVAVKTSGDPSSLSRQVTATLRSLDRGLPIAGLRSANRVVESAMAPTAFTMLLLSIAAAVAMLLGSIGIYGVVSYVVSQRTREIGVRMALGADRGRVGRMIVGGALAIAAAGVGVGLVAAVALTRLMTTVLFGVKATDPATFVIVVGVLMGVTALASYLPARRAASIQPTEALRYE